MSNAIDRRGNIDSVRASKRIKTIISNSDEYAGLPADLKEFIDRQLYASEHINQFTPSSALGAKVRSTGILQAIGQRHFQNLLSDQIPPYLATFSFVNGEVEPGHQLQNVQTTIKAATDALLSEKLQGILVPDIEIIIRPDGSKPLICFHLHGLVTSFGQKIRLKKAAERMSSLINLSSSLPWSVKLSGKRLGDPRIHAENMATYLGKLSSALKVGYLDDDGKTRYHRTTDGLLPIHAFAILCAWSQIPLRSSVHAVGELGEGMRNDWLRIAKRQPLAGGTQTRFRRREIKAGWQDVFEHLRGSRLG